MKTIFKLAAMFFLLTAFTFSNVNAQITLTGSAGTTIDGTYATLTGPGALPNTGGGVFAALNANAQTGIENIIVTITANTAETGANSLNAGLWATILIKPSGGSWTCSGAPAAGTPLINLDGADNVTFDGLNTGGNALTISNTTIGSTAGTCTMRFINDASNNTVTNCSVTGSSTSTIATVAGTIVFSTGVVTGNDNNTISNCNIGPVGANLPTKGIMSLGSTTSAGIRNSNNLINNNNIFDYFLPAGSAAGFSIAGINLNVGNDLWTISRNRMYQTAPRVCNTTTQRYNGIILSGGSTLPGSFTVTNNIIGFGSSTQTGTTTISGSSNEFRGIDMPSVENAATPTSLQGNIISGIDQTSSRASTTTTSAAFIAILGGYSVDGRFEIGNISGNQIGSTDGSSTIVLRLSSTTASTAPSMGIYEFGDGVSKVSNNQIGYIRITRGAAGAGTINGFRAIFITTVAPGTATDVKENVITDIADSLVGGYTMTGIVVTGKAPYVYKNTIRNFVGLTNLANTVVMTGILVNSTTGTTIIEKNDVHNLRDTVSNANLVAIYGYDMTLSSSTANEVKQNYCYANEIWGPAPATTSQIFGMQLRAGVATTYNNMITLGLKSNGSSITIPFNIRGMQDSDPGAVSKSYYYNSVYITGSGVASGGSNTFCLNSTSIGTRIFENNILWNDRDNPPALGIAQYAVGYAGAGVNPPGLLSNYNDLVATGTNGVLGFYSATNQPNLAAWTAATGQDANSSSVTVNFVMPSAGDLHLTGASIGDLNLTGTPIPGITTDIDKNIRHDNQWERPYMGAHEPQQALPVELASFTSAVSGRDAVLNWSTSSEINNQGFDVERKTDGEWSKVGSVNGNGTTNETHNYSFTDRNLNNGTYNYRLKQIDFNGHFEYFNLSNEVIIGIPEKYNLSQNYPNPFNPSTKINYDLPFDSKVSIKLFDMSGREVATLVNENISAGYHSINFNGANLSSGTYFYKIVADANGNNFTSVKKMVLIK